MTHTRITNGRTAVLLCAFAIIMTTPSVAPAQVGYSLAFLAVPSSGRAVGMGGSGSAVIDMTGAPLNPGTLGVFALQGRSGIARNVHRQPDQIRIGGKYSNSFVVASYGQHRYHNASGFQFALGVGYHRQFSDRGTIPYNPITRLGPYHIYERSNNFTLAGGIRYGVEIGFGVTLKDYRSFHIPNAVADGLLRDVGVIVRVPIGETLARITKSEYQVDDGFRFDVAIAASHVWANRGNDVKYIDAQQPDPPPRLRRLGMSAEGTIEYRQTKVIGILVSRDEERSAVDELRMGLIRREGVEFDILGIVRLQSGSYDSVFGGEDGASGIAVHLNGVWDWLDVVLSESGNSQLPEWLDRVDVYYQDATLDGVPNLLSGGLGYREAGVSVRLFGVGGPHKP